jgi:hypothetical protein
MDHTILTSAGVNEVDQPAGAITVRREEGSTLAELIVGDGAGQDVTVYLDYHQVVELVMTLGKAGSEL